MNLGIDASNLRAGGGVTHLIEFLTFANPQANGFEQVFVWGSLATLERLPSRPWLHKQTSPYLEKTYPFRFYWQQYKLGSLARQVKCNLLFVPGGMYLGDFRPFVTMSRNMLPFDWGEIIRYGLHPATLRLILLRFGQSVTFRRTNGLIFLSKYAKKTVTKIAKLDNVATVTIPHGVSEKFRCAPRSTNLCTNDDPLNILYVSTVSPYKHQWKVAQAVALLRQQGFNLTLDLIGSGETNSLDRLKTTLAQLDPTGNFLRYHGKVPYTEIMSHYHGADIFVFASTVENMPNILLEAMASGLPIVCSNREPMPEILADAGIYMDPTDHENIASSLKQLITDPKQRQIYADQAFNQALGYSWDICTQKTLEFLHQVATGSSSNGNN